MDTEIIDKLKPFLSELYGVPEDDIKPETDLFDDLGSDRFDIIELSMILEEEFDIITDDEKLAEVATVAELSEYVSEMSDL